ncbi:hypothetical protein HK099_006873 [Clydaea vesicula]|uniref:Atos-like conserved domain-containing protein n=1 Tax=Clydaea vesicula TaxID=447962 RepID=A0AAD5TXV0_9FUNG|nr:hypothetical protein HK099_006873 [Clydaea vesicula]KAJ3380315.1 hypothetical protein HDU92_006060 [Lobulomyces angularis]
MVETQIIKTTPYPSPIMTRKQSIAQNCASDKQFVGSYEESLLKSRMSTSPSKPVLFTMEIGCSGIGKNLPLKLRLPKHKFYLFEACSFDLIDNSVQDKNCSLNDRITVTPFCGSLTMDERYRIPTKGQLQIIIKNPSSTAIKVFLIPYDHTNMPSDTKAISRQKTYSNCNKKKTKTLLSAIHLQYIKINKRLYIDKKMRLVFSSRSFPEFKDEVFNVLNQTKFEYVKIYKFDNVAEDLFGVNKNLVERSLEFNKEGVDFNKNEQENRDNDNRDEGHISEVAHINKNLNDDEDLSFNNEMEGLDLNR